MFSPVATVLLWVSYTYPTAPTAQATSKIGRLVMRLRGLRVNIKFSAYICTLRLIRMWATLKLVEYYRCGETSCGVLRFCGQCGMDGTCLQFGDLALCRCSISSIPVSLLYAFHCIRLFTLYVVVADRPPFGDDVQIEVDKHPGFRGGLVAATSGPLTPYFATYDLEVCAAE